MSSNVDNQNTQVSENQCDSEPTKTYEVEITDAEVSDPVNVVPEEKFVELDTVTSSQNFFKSGSYTDTFKQVLQDRLAHPDKLHLFYYKNLQCGIVSDKLNWNGFVHWPVDHPDKTKKVSQLKKLYKLDERATISLNIPNAENPQNWCVGFDTTQNGYTAIYEIVGEDQENIEYCSFECVKGILKTFVDQIVERHNVKEDPTTSSQGSEEPEESEESDGSTETPDSDLAEQLTKMFESMGFKGAQVCVVNSDTPASDAVKNVFSQKEAPKEAPKETPCKSAKSSSDEDNCQCDHTELTEQLTKMFESMGFKGAKVHVVNGDSSVPDVVKNLFNQEAPKKSTEKSTDKPTDKPTEQTPKHSQPVTSVLPENLRKMFESMGYKVCETNTYSLSSTPKNPATTRTPPTREQSDNQGDLNDAVQNLKKRFASMGYTDVNVIPLGGMRNDTNGSNHFTCNHTPYNHSCQTRTQMPTQMPTQVSGMVSGFVRYACEEESDNDYSDESSDDESGDEDSSSPPRSVVYNQNGPVYVNNNTYYVSDPVSSVSYSGDYNKYRDYNNYRNSNNSRCHLSRTFDDCGQSLANNGRQKSNLQEGDYYQDSSNLNKGYNNQHQPRYGGDYNYAERSFKGGNKAGPSYQGRRRRVANPNQGSTPNVYQGRRAPQTVNQGRAPTRRGKSN